MMKWWGWGAVGKEYPVQDKPGIFPFMKERCGIDEASYSPPVRLEEIRLPKPRVPAAFVRI